MKRINKSNKGHRPATGKRKPKRKSLYKGRG